jgi:hypothetical protein
VGVTSGVLNGVGVAVGGNQITVTVGVGVSLGTGVSGSGKGVLAGRQLLDVAAKAVKIIPKIVLRITHYVSRITPHIF